MFSRPPVLASAGVSLNGMTRRFKRLGILMLRSILLSMAGLTIGASALANECFVREYSDAHLAANPSQSVRALQVRFITEGDYFAEAKAWFRDDDRIWKTSLECWDEDVATIRCAVECDGGSFTAPTVRGKDIVITTRGGFAVGPGCGSDEATRYVTDAGAQETKFKLFRAEDSACN